MKRKPLGSWLSQGDMHDLAHQKNRSKTMPSADRVFVTGASLSPIQTDDSLMRIWTVAPQLGWPRIEAAAQ